MCVGRVGIGILCDGRTSRSCAHACARLRVRGRRRRRRACARARSALLAQLLKSAAERPSCFYTSVAVPCTRRLAEERPCRDGNRSRTLDAMMCLPRAHSNFSCLAELASMEEGLVMVVFQGFMQIFVVLTL